MAPVLLLLSIFATAVSAVPVLDSGISSNVLIPNENGTLEYATPAQRTRRLEPFNGTRKLSRRADCSSAPASEAECDEYCEHAVTDVLGDPVKVSADINCDVSTCSIAHADTVTITQSFTISLGGSSPAGDHGNSILTAGASFTWSKSVMTGNTYTFTPKDGDVGYIVFKPRFKQSCGLFTKWTAHETQGVPSRHTCTSPMVSQDQNACGRSPINLDNGEADGQYSFCNTNTKDGC